MNNKPKIVPTPFPDNTDIGIQEMSVTYVQNPDTNDDSEHYQYLKITTQDVAGTDSMPYYVNISIPNFDDGTPGHWSLDLDEDLTPILNDFKKLLENKRTEKENNEK